MLDKEVVKFTRNGLQKRNLASGETQMLYLSDYAKEEKYHNPAGEKDVFGRHSSEEIPNDDSASTFTARRKIRRPDKEAVESYTQPRGVESSTNPLNDTQRRYQGLSSSLKEPTPPSEGQRKQEKSGSGKADRETGIKRSISKRQQTKYYYSPKSGVAAPAHAELRKGSVRRLGFKLGNRVKERFKPKDNQDEENLGIRASKAATHDAQDLRAGVRTLKNIERKERMAFQTNDYVPASTRYTYGTAKTAAAAAKNEKVASAARPAAVAVKRQIVQKSAAIAKNPAVMKGAVIAGAIVLLILLFGQLLNSVTTSVTGAATDHPDLTAFVQQLDSNFLEKITTIKADYEKQPNTDVVIQGSDVVNTDPNDLAILATGDWTYIELTDENKVKLTACYNVLNTYTVTDRVEKVKEYTSGTASGAASESETTYHHITITISTYTAKAKIDSFGFTDAQKKNALDMLELLYLIENGGGIANGTNSGAATAPSQSFSDPQVQALVNEANLYLGYPYVWGGSNPQTSFDCSGFVCWVYTHSGVHNLPRTTAQGLYDECAPVSKEDAQPGDLIFFTQTYPTSSTVTHVGIYVGNDRMIHCGDPIQYTTLDKPYWQEHFYSFGRPK